MKKATIVLILSIFLTLPLYAASTKISGMTDGSSSITSITIVPVVRGGANEQVTVEALHNAAVLTADVTTTGIDSSMIPLTTGTTPKKWTLAYVYKWIKAKFDSVYQALDSDLTSWGSVTPSANTLTLAPLTYAEMRTTMGVQAYDADLTTWAGITPSANVQSLLGAANYAAMRTTMGLAIGTNVQAYDADLGSLAAGITGLVKGAGNGSGYAAATAGTDYSTPSSTDTLTNKTLDANATGNTVKGYGFITLRRPNNRGSATTAATTTETDINYGMPTFADDVESNNYIDYFCEVPRDLDTSVDLVAWFKFRLSAADTGDHDYIISMVAIADSAAQAGTPDAPINLSYTADGSGASGDVETAGGDTLTSWKSNVTAGNIWMIRITRDGDDSTNDASTVDSYPVELTIRYGFTQ
jgi:hypothetical protein